MPPYKSCAIGIKVYAEINVYFEVRNNDYIFTQWLFCLIAVSQRSIVVFVIKVKGLMHALMCIGM